MGLTRDEFRHQVIHRPQQEGYFTIGGRRVFIDAENLAHSTTTWTEVHPAQLNHVGDMRRLGWLDLAFRELAVARSMRACVL